MKLGLYHFQLLYQVLERIHYLYDEDELANAVLQSISMALNAEGGSIFKLMPDKTLHPLAAYGVPLERLRTIPFESGRGVVGWVVQHGQPVKVDKPALDQRFGSGNIDSMTGFKTQSILAAPILAKGIVVGVIEFLNRKDGPFSAPDLELVSMIGREVGIAFENANLIKDLKRTQALLDATTASLTAGMMIVDPESKVLKLNPSGMRILDVAKESDLLGQPVSKVLAAYQPFLGAMEEAVASAGPLQRREVKIHTKRGERVIGYSGMPVLDSSGIRLGTALLFQDITDFIKTRS